MSSTWIDTPAEKFILPDIKGKTAVVTGASLGIGRATAALLLENGARVFGLSRNRGDLEHPNFVQIPCDLSETDAIQSAFTQIEQQTSVIDYVVNVAGADPKHFIDEVQVAEWDRLFDLNLRAYYFVIKHALPFLRQSEGRSIVNVSSINYRLGIPGRAPYSATKAGILGLTTGLSSELGRENIRVNTVTPGWIFTERQVEEYFNQTDGDKYLDFLSQQQSMLVKITATDIANHILFYLSKVSRASVAHNCVVDGGWILE